MIEIVGLTISCVKGQETSTRPKVKYNKKETLCSTTLQEEATSILAVYSEEQDKEEDRSYVITAHNQDTLQGIVKTLMPLAATAAHLTML